MTETGNSFALVALILIILFQKRIYVFFKRYYLVLEAKLRNLIGQEEHLPRVEEPRGRHIVSPLINHSVNSSWDASRERNENQAYNLLRQDEVRRRPMEDEVKMIRLFITIRDFHGLYTYLDHMNRFQMAVTVGTFIDLTELLSRTSGFEELLRFVTYLAGVKFVGQSFFQGLFNTPVIKGRCFMECLKIIELIWAFDIFVTVSNLNVVLDICAEDRSASIQCALDLFENYERVQGHFVSDMTFNILMKACARKGELQAAWYVYSILKQRNVQLTDILFTSLIDCFAESKQGSTQDAWMVIHEMQEYGISPNVRTFNAFLKVCSRRAYTAQAHEVVHYMNTAGVSLDQLSYNTLIDCFANSQDGTVLEAKAFLEEMKKNNVSPDVRTYTSLMKVCSRRHVFDSACELYHDMLTAKVPPNVVTFNTLIDCCVYNSAKSADAAFNFLAEMEKYKIKGNCTTYTALMKVCVKKNQMERAVSVLNIMKEKKISPNAWTLTTLGMQKKSSQAWDYYEGPPLVVEGRVYGGPKHDLKRGRKALA